MHLLWGSVGMLKGTTEIPPTGIQKRYLGAGRSRRLGIAGFRKLGAPANACTSKETRNERAPPL